MKNAKKTGNDLVERYCPRLDKNIAVYPHDSEEIGYTCLYAESCDVKHCFMAAAAAEQNLSANQKGTQPSQSS